MRIPQIAKLRGDADPADTCIELMAEEGGAISGMFHTMSESDVREVMRKPWVAIASDGSAMNLNEDGVPHPRSFSTNPRVLGHYVRDEHVLTLEDAVRKMTSLPAQILGLRDRGQIREGFAADLVIFNSAAVRETTTFEKTKSYPEGIPYTIVNGVVVIDNGKHTGARPGRPLLGRGLKRIEIQSLTGRMYPTFIRLGEFEVTSFGVLVALAALVGLWIFHRELARSGLPASGVDAALVGVLGGLAGAKIIWAIEFRHTAPFLSLLLSRGGLSWFGGFLGGVGAGLWSLHRRRIPLVPALAAASPALAVGHAIGRIGCFLVGDDYGRPTDPSVGRRVSSRIAADHGAGPSHAVVRDRRTCGDRLVAHPMAPQGVADAIVFGRYLVVGRSAAISHRVHPRQCARGRALDAGAIILCRHHGYRFMVHAQPERKQQEEGRAMTAITRSALMTVVICAGLTEAGSTAGQTARIAPPTSGQTMLGVTGAVNATPSLTVDGRTIAAVWTASKDGVANV